MAIKANVQVGGYHTANPANIQALIGTYYDIADQYNLETLTFEPHHQMTTPDPEMWELVGVYFRYAKNGIPKSAIQTAIDEWVSICASNNIDIDNTNIKIYEE